MRCVMSASNGSETTSLSRLSDDEIPVYPTIASQFNDPGVNKLFRAICKKIDEKVPAEAVNWEPEVELAEPSETGTATDPGTPVPLSGGNCGRWQGRKQGIEGTGGDREPAQACHRALQEIDADVPAALEAYPDSLA